MNAEIITIGDEILIGQIVDTNSAFIATELNKIGVSVVQISSIQDNKQHIIKAFQEAETRADIIIVTGGLGPTKDDITKHTICEYFNDTLIENTEVLAHITQLFQKIANKPLNNLNKQQALVPSKAVVLPNKNGTAPGMWIEKKTKTFIALPGVPYEMKAIITDEVVPLITRKFTLPYIIHKTIVTQGEPESELAERIAFWEDALPQNISLAYLPNLGMVKLRLTAKGVDKKKIEQQINNQIALILPHLKEIFVGFEEASLETEIIKLLQLRKQTLSVAESCTGGLLASSITKNAGVSSFFKGGVVTYQTETKTQLLGVLPNTIDKYSVVSAAVATEMVVGCQKVFQSDYAISITGNAGPEKGDSDAEVGTVYIAVSSPQKVTVECFHFGTNRYRVQNKAKNKALELLKKVIFASENN